MFVFLLSVVFAGILLQAVVLGEECVTAHYKELGCVPGPGEKSTNCPSSFSCPSFFPDDLNCYYKGDSYSIKTKIPSNKITSPCSIDCLCTQSQFDNRPTFACAAIDCPEFFGEDRDESCIAQYSFNSCCAEKEVCGNEEISKLSTCEWEGRTYREGERFYPSNTCKSCICGANFNGNLDIFCRDVNCGIEIHDQLALAEKCAPVFTKTGKCCPIYWKCPEGELKIVSNNKSKFVSEPSSRTATCAFGNNTLRVGESVLEKDACTSCTCRTPPLLTCILDTECDQEPNTDFITTQPPIL